MPDTTVIERQVLTNAAWEADELTDYIGIVTPEMFTTDARRKIWSSILQMYNAGEPINPSTLRPRLTKEELHEITAEGIRAESFSALTHALQLRDASTKRRAYQAALAIIYKSCDPSVTETEILAEITAAAESVESETLRPEESGMADIINEVAADLQQWKDNAATGRRNRISTGFRDLDNITNQGWGEGQLIVLAARPSVGKTAVMLHFAKAAAENGYNAGIFTLEMTKKELVSRLLFSTGRITPDTFYEGSVTWEDFESAAGCIAGLPIVVNSTANRLSEIISRMTALHNRGKCDIALIDYLGLMKNESNGRIPLTQIIAENTSTLKATAKKLGIPIILLAQLNREAAKDGAPQLYHLRDSGGIEQDADVVLMLEQTDLSNGDPLQPCDLKMWVRKNRHGKKEIAITLEPDRSYTIFTEKGMTQ